MIFRDPWFLALIPVVTGIILLTARKKWSASIRFPSETLLTGIRDSYKTKALRNIHLLRILAAILVCLALARPQSVVEEIKVASEGIDIVLVLDASTSMLAEDFKSGDRRVSRIDAVKEVSREFIRRRANDRVGIVIFAARAYTVCPLTLDHEWALQHLDRIDIGMIEDNTAIGSGLSTALNRLRETRSKTKVLILLTDGRNNTGEIPPLTAAAAARALNIRVYTIGAGSKGAAPYPARDPFGKKIYRDIPLDIDEDLLKEVAASTGSKYFRATDRISLEETFGEIDRLEKTSVTQKLYRRYGELFPWFLIPGMILLCMEFALKQTVLRKIP